MIITKWMMEGSVVMETSHVATKMQLPMIGNLIT